MTEEQLQYMQIIRNFLDVREDTEPYDSTLTQAKRFADEFTEKTGIKAMVIRKKNKYDWVSKYYFNTYDYKGKIYYETHE